MIDDGAKAHAQLIETLVNKFGCSIVSDEIFNVALQ
jgi:hypothetical protein